MAIGNQAAAINFGINAGASNIVPNNGSGQVNHEKAEFWVNVGCMMPTGKFDEQGQPITMFVQLPSGIPLETPETLKAKKVFMSDEKLKFLKKMTLLGETLKPGETMMVGGVAGGLLLQLRRVDLNKTVADTSTDLPDLKIGVF